MTRRILISTAWTVLLLTFSMATDAQIQQGHVIRGKVRNSAGYNMGHIRVDLEAGNGPLIQQTVTNSEGDFYFTNLAETSYAVVVSVSGYEPVEERVDFFRQAANAPGETRVVEITLVPKAGVHPPRPGLDFVQNVPKAARDLFELAIKQSREHKDQEALTSLQDAIKKFPDFFDAHFVLANEFIKRDILGEAITQLDEARRINPKDDRVYQLFGLVMMQQRKYAVAARVYAEAARLNPNEPQYLLMQGTALIDQAGTIDPAKSKAAADERDFALTEAEKDLTRAYQLSGKKLTIVHLYLAKLYEKKGERARAADELEQYLRQTSDAKNAGAIRDAITKLRGSAGQTKPAAMPR